MKRIILVGPFIWFVIHYAVPYIYIKTCTPYGIGGFMQSILLINTPHCEALRYVLSLSSYNIKCMLILWGAGVMSFLTTNLSVEIPNKANPQSN